MTKREDDYDKIVVPGAAYVQGPTSKVHLWNAGTEEETAAQQMFFHRLLEKSFAKRGDGGEIVGGTNILTEIGWIATNFWRVMRDLGEIKAILLKLALGQGVVIDYKEIAREVADEQARRLTPKDVELPKEETK